MAIMMAPLSASPRGPADASKDAARTMLRTESMRLKDFGPLPSMRNPSTRRVVRRAWTVGRLTPAFSPSMQANSNPGVQQAPFARRAVDAAATKPARHKFAGSPASEQSAHHAADQANRAADTAVMASTTAAATTARRSFSGFAAGAGTRTRRWHGFGQQRLMLQRVEQAGLGIAACPLPARDDRAGRFVELSVGLDVEAEARQPALHVFTPCPVEADLIFGFLGCFLGKDHHWIDGFRQVAGGRARTVLQRGDPRQGDRFELTVGKAGQIGTEFASPVRILDRTPELELNLRSGAGRGSLRIRRSGGSGGGPHPGWVKNGPPTCISPTAVCPPCGLLEPHPGPPPLPPTISSPIVGIWPHRPP